jgi:hypothetical protein
MTMTPEQFAEVLARQQTQLDRIESIVNGISVNALPAFEKSAADGFDDVIVLLKQIEQDVNGPAPDDTPVSVRFVVPTYRDIATGKVLKMAFSVLNDVITNIPLEFDNLAGQKVAVPAGGTVTLALLDPTGAVSTLGAVAMGADGTSVDVTPTLPAGSSLGDATISFDDQANVDLKAPLDITFGNDPAAANVHFVTTGATTRPMGP